jgi:hypothetical protein
MYNVQANISTRLKFAAVKALAIQNLLELEKQNKITREDGFQGILNAIAGDVRSKHRKRLQRQQEMESMNEALRQLAERKKYLEEQMDTYHSFYAETHISTMAKGKGSVFVPLLIVYKKLNPFFPPENVLLFLSASSGPIFATFKGPAKLHNLDHSYTRLRSFMTEASFYLLTNFPLVNSTSCK